MMATAHLFACAAFVFIAFLAGRQDVSLIQLAGWSLLLFAVVSFIISWLIAPLVDVWDRVWRSKKQEVGEEELRARQKQAIDLAQAEHNEKAEEFAERQAELLRQRAVAKSEALNRGSLWAGKGRAVAEKNSTEKQARSESPDLAGAREEELTVKLSPAPSEDCSEVELLVVKLFVSRISTSPQEICVFEATNLIFRLPNGTIKRRLFMVTASCQELYAFVESLGFSSERYALYALRPRQLIPCTVNRKVGAFSPGRGIAVVVEERER